MVDSSDVKELWGTEFHVVADGLSEEEVVSYVEKLKDEAQKAKQEHDRQSSLLKLAEQTVVEADKLAESIKIEARQEAEAETAKMVAGAEGQAQEQVQRLLRKAERDAAAQTAELVAKAEQESQDAIERARKEGQEIIAEARDRVTSIESEAKLEAEYIVRRFTVKFVEEIRSAVNEASNNLLPSLDDVVSEASKQVGANDKGDQPAIESERKTKSSSRR